LSERKHVWMQLKFSFMVSWTMWIWFFVISFVGTRGAFAQYNHKVLNYV
jgi:hypothetical protein